MPFGSERDHTGSVTTDYKFTDQELDRSTGLYNYDARLYDPVVGRFVSPDTIVQNPTDPQMLNRYSYVRNNPLIYTDPSGHAVDFGKLYPDYSPPKINLGNYSPPKINVGNYSPPKVNLGNYSAPKINLGNYSAPKINLGNGGNAGKSSTSWYSGFSSSVGGLGSWYSSTSFPYASSSDLCEYATPLAAVTAAFGEQSILFGTIANDTEYCGWIVKTEDGFSPSLPIQGQRHECQPGPKPHNAVALYHTHGAQSRYYDERTGGWTEERNEYFSCSDMLRSNLQDVDNYLLTPSGTIRIYVSGTVSVTWRQCEDNPGQYLYIGEAVASVTVNVFR